MKADSALRNDADQHLSFEDGLLKITRGAYQFSFNFAADDSEVEYKILESQKVHQSENYNDDLIGPKRYAINILGDDC